MLLAAKIESDTRNYIELNNLCMHFIHYKCNPTANVTKYHFLSTRAPYHLKCIIKYKLLGMQVQEPIYSFMELPQKVS